MRQPQSCRATRHGPLAFTVSVTAVLAGTLFGLGAACADPVPLPTVDFALSADLRRGGSMDLAHSQGRMRVEMTKPNVPGSIVGIIDLRARRMVVRTPNLPNMAVEMELPPEYALGALSGSGLRVGESQVAGEACDLWKLDAPSGAVGGVALGPTTACITPDGIALRTEVEVQGKKQTVFEALKLTRAPQDPKLFQLPAGVQVIKVPKGKIGSALGLPNLGAPLLDLAPKP
ncbi:hypothetical protein V5F40_08875 [Xanthobacter sp. DSM 14520]|uniref:hypothetical protein n=1 Tax=Xanthobacter autotrophicus (strain ATCC BAA-1158 / Py2) TaxID=78245 RepID=UPI003726F169